MIRVLFIARYRDQTMWRKLDVMGRDPRLELHHIFPAYWQDELLQRPSSLPMSSHFTAYPLSMWGKVSDPHRAIYKNIAPLIKKIQPQLIHIEEEPDSLAALQISLLKNFLVPKTSLFLHTWQNISRPLQPWVKWVERISLRASDAVFCANQEAVLRLESELNYHRPRPVIPAVGVDTTVFQPPADPVPTRPLTIGFAGRLAAEKGVNLLIQAFASFLEKHPESRLRILGAGPEMQALQSLSRASGTAAQIDFDPPRPPANVAVWLHEIDILVLPSLTTPVWKEQLGRILLEAMASKVVVIGSDSGAIPDVIGDSSLIFPENDVSHLSNLLTRLADDGPLRRAKANALYNRVIKTYSQAALAEKTVAFYMSHA